MRLGIDLGTTRTVVAVEDRGNYPVVGFLAGSGDLVEHYPSISAEVGGKLVHGLEAVAAARAGAPWLGSWKRLFSERGARAQVSIGTVTLSLADLTASFLSALRHDLFTQSNLPKRFADPLEAVISVPANAHSTQRFLTLEAFRRAGFTVRGMLNEPSAAGLEYAHRYRDTINSRREHVVIYDLGGGTFDAAVVMIAGGQHDVLATSGIARLGGDDFDEALLEMALKKAGITRAVTPTERGALLLECRLVKEALNPNSRRLVIDLTALGEDAPEAPVVIPVGDYYERVRPLVLQSMEALEPVLAAETADAKGNGITDADLAGIYVVGGASGLPLVPRVLRERFGRRVHRSPYPSAATAIGLAVAAERDEPVHVRERLTRHLGVFREGEGGARISFDSIFAQGTPMPAPGSSPMVVVRSYQAAHNLGHYRFIECSALDASGGPCGDITPHAEIRCPFAPELRGRADLAETPVERLPRDGPWIEERYEIDAGGIVTITITDRTDGYSQRCIL